MQVTCPHCQRKFALARINSELGRRKSAAKASAARLNGKKGGRPPKKKEGCP